MSRSQIEETAINILMGGGGPYHLEQWEFID